MTFKAHISAIWDYVRNSWEDEQGHLSYKRISQFIWSWLIVVQVLKGSVTGRWEFYTLLALIVLFSLTAAMITVPQLITLVKSYNRLPEHEDPIEKKEATTKPENPDK
jgi:hypothetical protein